MKSHKQRASTERRNIHVQGIKVELLRRGVKNISLRVSASSGQVRLTVPWVVDDKAAERFVLSKWDWIKRQQAKITRQPVARMVDGERHPFMGRHYPLQLIEHAGRPHLTLSRDTLCLHVRPDTPLSKREALLESWYRQQLKEQVPALITKWEPIIGVTVNAWGIKKMRTRWGSCNINAARVWLSLELAKKPPQCLEYVLVHEMVHLLERYHNARFYGFMDRFLPDWREQREALKANACIDAA